MKTSRLLKAALLLSFCTSLGFYGPGSQAAAAEVNVYSARKEVLIKPLFDTFTAETGITVNLVSAKADALLQRLEREGANSPADVFLTTDAGRLAKAKQRGLLQPVSSELLDAAIPAQYRDPDGVWYGLSIRARPIIYAVDRVKPAELSSYLALAGPDWKGRVCVRSSSNIYNQSLLASFIHHQGVDLAEGWAKGLVANFARKPQGGDTDQIRAVAAGECDVALANTYYLARLTVSSKEADRAVAAKVAIFWPDQAGAGVHVNISGAGVTRAATNRAEAIALLEFLAGQQAQRNYAEVVHEYPIRGDVAWSDVVSAWGRFKADEINLAILGRNNAEAVRIADRAGWR
ncbi:MAG: Fe(3+) ABC transporter substrate-binding protein [Alphaproteobacteria bacterium]